MEKGTQNPDDTEKEISITRVEIVLLSVHRDLLTLMRPTNMFIWPTIPLATTHRADHLTSGTPCRGRRTATSLSCMYVTASQQKSIYVFALHNVRIGQ